MRRSICFCEPATALAGEVSDWKFFYTPSINLPKGTKLKLNIGSQGRNIDWQAPEAGAKKASNVIYGVLPSGKILIPNELKPSAGSIVPEYEFTLTEEVSEGDAINITLGSPHGKSGNSAELGNMAQTSVQRRKPFNLYIDPKGKGHYEEPEVFLMDIRGNKLHTIRIIAPSFVARNKRFDVIVRFEDIHGNLTNNAPEDTLIELTHQHLRENLNWKLFVPETGFITLPNIYFNEPGVYTIKLKNLKTGEHYTSAPIMCQNETDNNIFWGLLHGESDRVDSTENIESCLRHFRDDKAYNFFTVSPFESAEETSNETWKQVLQNVMEFNEADRFTSILGFQWHGNDPSEGVRHIIYSKDNKQIMRKKDAKFNSLKKIYKSISPGEAISIPCFTMSKKFGCNFEEFQPEFEKVVEIYNAWGSSECSVAEGNQTPIDSPDESGTKSSIEGAVLKALMKNHRFGFVAGGLDDRGIYSELFDSSQTQYHPGMTAIIAKEHSREALFQAVFNRSCYATTGKRIILGLSIAGVGMGGETTTTEKPGLLMNRHISGYVAGNDEIESVEIIRNGKVWKKLTLDPNTHLFSADDMESMDAIAIKPADKKPPFVFYYVRVTQKDKHMAWSSPIWIDITSNKVVKPVVVKRGSKIADEED